jgi:ribosomal protein S18 acetylase RimI-like enzyme
MKVNVRDADLTRDRETLQRFILGSNTYEAQWESDRRLDPEVGADHLADLNRRAATKRGRMFVAEVNGAVVGWAMCHADEHEAYVLEEERSFGYVAELFVEEAHRGLHIGRHLLEACESHFSEIGIKIVLIGALSPNTRAVNAYRAAGYADYAINLRKVL